MNIYITQPFPHEAMTFYEAEDFFMLHVNGHRQSFQKRKDDRPALEISTGKLPYNKWMARDVSIVEEFCKSGVSLPQM